MKWYLIWRERNLALTHIDNEFFDVIVLEPPHVILCHVSNVEHIHKILCRPPTITSWVSTFYWLVPVWIKRWPCCRVTFLFKFGRKKSHVSIISPLTMAKAIGRILLLSSSKTARRRVPYTYHTIMFHRPESWACNIETHWYTV